MKPFFGLAIAAIAVFSCKKPDLRPEPDLKKENKPVQTSDVGVESSGDGLLDVLGWGYDATKEYANANSVGFQVIDLVSFKAAHPGRLIDEYAYSQEYSEFYGAEARQYLISLSSKVDNSASVPVFKKILTVGFSASLTATGTFDGKYIYGSYDLTIKQKRVRLNADAAMLQGYLTPEFLADVDAYYTTPQTLVQRYGTHVMVDIYTGAKLDIVFQSETTNQNRALAARIGIKAGVKDVFGVDIQNSVDASNSTQNYSRKLYYRTRGGNPSYALANTISLDQSNPTINIANWQGSSTVSNSVLVDFGQQGILYLYDFIADPTKRAAVKAYIDQYLINGQGYVDHLSIPVYRYWNNNVGDHYYSLTQDGGPGWNYEGIEFQAYSYQAPGTVPVYRYWNLNSGDHFYTKASGTPSGYVSEGIGFYAFPNQSTGTVPIYRFWSVGASDHFYSRNPGTPPGYVAEGVEFYAF